jgi:hypothetical protein
VHALTTFDDGGGASLYAGGDFGVAGGVNASDIAKWNGTSWSALGSGISGDEVRALTTFDDGGGEAIYAGGNFGTAGGMGTNDIAKWDGSSWSALSLGMNNAVYALSVFDDGGGPALYAGGAFTTAGPVSAPGIARWDGSSWSALGSGMGGSYHSVLDLTVFDDGGGEALFAAGQFTTAGGINAKYIARWDGSSWSALGSGMGGTQHPFVYALTVFNDGGGPALYAGGGFTTAGGASANYIAKWNGSNWSALGSGTDESVVALMVFDDGGGPALYAGGHFTTAGGAGANHIAKWDGSSWSALGSGTDGEFPYVYALTVFDDGGGPALYAGGYFTSAGGVGANHIAKWDGSNWSALGSGTGGEFPHVYALMVFDDGGGPALYAGGYFTSAGGVGANHIAKWDGSSWSALGSGTGGGVPYVHALSAFDGGSGPALYVGGQFTIAGGNVSPFIAQWTCCPACADSDHNGIRDDPCLWYSCSAGVCSSTPRGFGNGGQSGQADMASPGGSGTCDVDGVADANDRFHALNCFSNSNFGSPGSYPCEPGSPNALNVDAGSSASCVLDGVCDVNDAFHALNSFSNANFGMPGGYPCTCSGSAPRPSAPRVEPREHTGIALRVPRRAAPGELVHVDVHLTDGLAALRGYQLHLSAAGGKRGALEPADVSIDSARDDYVFAGAAGVWTAFNRSTGQMLAGMDALEGVPASPGAYLATFSYRVPKDGAGTIVVEARFGDRSPATQDRTFLFGAYARPIGIEAGLPVRIAVEEGNRGRRKH